MNELKSQIIYIDRVNKKKCIEKVYGAKALKLLYGDDLVTKWIGAPLLHTLVKNALFSRIYGFFQNTNASKKKIKPFIKNFEIDESEFLESSESFTSFNDFFVRKLKPESRPIYQGDDIAIIPADGRYLFYPNIDEAKGFVVKGQKFNLETLLQDKELSKKYTHGTMIIARLCPTDYHRFHFPVDSDAGKTKLINGFLYSVNPIAIKKDIHIFTQNKRTITELKSDKFGTVLFLEIGATSVGTITETYTPNQFYKKGEEKGYFSFGASSLILLFEKNRLSLDPELVEATNEGFEIKCLMGQRMGISKPKSY